jgi:hypothetical protein
MLRRHDGNDLLQLHSLVHVQAFYEWTVPFPILCCWSGHARREHCLAGVLKAKGGTDWRKVRHDLIFDYRREYMVSWEAFAIKAEYTEL